MFSGIYFKEMRQIVLILLSMNQGIRLLDIIVIISVVLNSGRFKPDRSQDVNDFEQMLKLVYTGNLFSPEISN